MKKLVIFIFTVLVVFSCFEQPEISTPMFVSKSSPDSLIEKGIDANIDNSIYLEWNEPASASLEGINGYHLYRGILVDEEYAFEKIATIERENGVIFKSDEYTDYEVSLDTTYYYYLRSYNDFTISNKTSDTAQYKLVVSASLRQPTGDVNDSIPQFEFLVPRFAIDNISHFYLRLEYLENTGYQSKFFVKLHRFNYAQEQFFINLNSLNQHCIVLYDDVWTHDGRRYLEKGDYRWKIDAISSRLGGLGEVEGSESDWMEFTIK